MPTITTANNRSDLVVIIVRLEHHWGHFLLFKGKRLGRWQSIRQCDKKQKFFEGLFWSLNFCFNKIFSCEQKRLLHLRADARPWFGWPDSHQKFRPPPSVFGACKSKVMPLSRRNFRRHPHLIYCVLSFSFVFSSTWKMKMNWSRLSVSLSWLTGGRNQFSPSDSTSRTTLCWGS